MMRFFNRIGIASIEELGRCLFCVRAAFLSALGAWAMTLGLLVVAPNIGVVLLISVVAIAFTMLWAAHLTAHAVRFVHARQVSGVVRPGVAITGATRRQMIKMFVAAFAGIAAASAFMASTRRAMAADEGCPDEAPNSCGTQYCCAGQARHHCQGYSGYAEPWRTMVNFCTNADSDEDLADLRSNCAVFTTC